MRRLPRKPPTTMRPPTRQSSRKRRPTRRRPTRRLPRRHCRRPLLPSSPSRSSGFRFRRGEEPSATRVAVRRGRSSARRTCRIQLADACAHAGWQAAQASPSASAHPSPDPASSPGAARASAPPRRRRRRSKRRSRELACSRKRRRCRAFRPRRSSSEAQGRPCSARERRARASRSRPRCSRKPTRERCVVTERELRPDVDGTDSHDERIVARRMHDAARPGAVP